jgi:DNA-binding response OmpR family regulator
MDFMPNDGFDPPRRVLVVDDDDVTRLIIVTALTQAGYIVREAAGALAAMRAVLAEPLDVVVLDLILPDGHGIEVAGAFRAVATTRKLCVVAMTAHAESVTFVDPRTFGAAQILIKPINVEVLLAAVDGCFEVDWRAQFDAPIDERPVA